MEGGNTSGGRRPPPPNAARRWSVAVDVVNHAAFTSPVVTAVRNGARQQQQQQQPPKGPARRSFSLDELLRLGRQSRWADSGGGAVNKSPSSFRRWPLLHYFPRPGGGGGRPAGLAVVDLPGEKCRLISSVNGSELNSSLTKAVMEYKVQNYRLITASARTVLTLDSPNCLFGSTLEEIIEQDYEDADEDECDEKLDIVSELLESEGVYLQSLRSLYAIYAEPLRKFSPLTSEEQQILFMSFAPLLSLSMMLVSKLEDTVNLWDPSISRIGSLFSKKLWSHYEEYCANYYQAKDFLDQKFQTDITFLEFCKLRKESSGLSLDTLLQLPRQRLQDYEQYLSNLLDRTDEGHPDYKALSDAVTKVKMIIRESSVEDQENEQQIENVQGRFPHDELLLKEKPKMRKPRNINRRRKSAPGAVLFRSLSSSKSRISWSANSENVDQDIVNFNKYQSNVKRFYIMEGPVQLTTGLQTQYRYLFLFDDLLLEAKQKSSNHFKLKQRVGVSQIWLASCLDEVSEVSLSEEKSFVMGWPTVNKVATFATADLKEKWLTKLKEIIQEKKCKEIPQFVTITIQNKCSGETKELNVSNTTQASEVVKSCTELFQISFHPCSEDHGIGKLSSMCLQHNMAWAAKDSEANNYRLWVECGKNESSLYSLLGHEFPYSIKLNRIREYGDYKEGVCSGDSEVDIKCDFTLRHTKRLPKKHHPEENRNPKKSLSPFKRFKKFPREEKPTLATNPPQGKLFGQPLKDVSINDIPPKPIINLMNNLFQEGPFTHGIFRKSANAKKSKELRQKLDEEEDVALENVQAHVAGAVLKEYLRCLPQSLLMNDLYDEWIKASNVKNDKEKQQKLKELVDCLPQCNQSLLKRLMCVLHYINKHSSENDMTSLNLAVCITPNLLWPRDAIQNPSSISPITEIVQYMISNCAEILGDETMQLFGDPPTNELQADSDSDTEGLLSREDSSMDSLHDIYSSEIDNTSPQLGKSHLSTSNLSHDSGLTLSDSQLYDDEYSDVNANGERKVDTKSASNISDNIESNYLSDTINPVPPPRKFRRNSSEPIQPSQEFQKLRQQPYNLCKERTKHYSFVNKQSKASPLIIKQISLDSLQIVSENFENNTTFFNSSHLSLDEETTAQKSIFSQEKAEGKPLQQYLVSESTPSQLPQSKYFKDLASPERSKKSSWFQEPDRDQSHLNQPFIKPPLGLLRNKGTRISNVQESLETNQEFPAYSNSMVEKPSEIISERRHTIRSSRHSSALEYCFSDSDSWHLWQQNVSPNVLVTHIENKDINAMGVHKVGFNSYSSENVHGVQSYEESRETENTFAPQQHHQNVEESCITNHYKTEIHFENQPITKTLSMDNKSKVQSCIDNTSKDGKISEYDHLRHDRLPSYLEAINRNHIITQREKSARAKKLYEESVRTYTENKETRKQDQIQSNETKKKCSQQKSKYQDKKDESGFKDTQTISLGVCNSEIKFQSTLAESQQKINILRQVSTGTAKITRTVPILSCQYSKSEPSLDTVDTAQKSTRLKSSGHLSQYIKPALKHKVQPDRLHTSHVSGDQKYVNYKMKNNNGEHMKDKLHSKSKETFQKSDLPWSVAKLASRFDPRLSENDKSKHCSHKPVPPPYQDPPPFHRQANQPNHPTSNGSSSCPDKTVFSKSKEYKYGPQMFDYSSAEESDCSNKSKRSTSSVEEALNWNFTEVSYV